MAEMTAVNAVPAKARSPRRSAAEPVFRILTFASALSVLAVLGGVIVALVAGALPALRAFGFGFSPAKPGTPSRSSSARSPRSTARS